jgi:hypothetical protein
LAGLISRLRSGAKAHSKTQTGKARYEKRLSGESTFMPFRVKRTAKRATHIAMILLALNPGLGVGPGV